MTPKKLIGAAALSIMLLAGSAVAQTSTTSTSSTSTGTVGTPNTGLGGTSAVNLVVLGSSAAIALAGFALLSRRRELM